MRRLAAVALAALALGRGRRRASPQPTLARARERGDVPGLQDDARPVRLGPRRTDEAVHLAADRGRQTRSSEIERELVAQFGPAILAAPPQRGFGLLAWLLPIVGRASSRRERWRRLAWRWSRSASRSVPGSARPRSHGAAARPRARAPARRRAARFDELSGPPGVAFLAGFVSFLVSLRAAARAGLPLGGLGGRGRAARRARVCAPGRRREPPVRRSGSRSSSSSSARARRRSAERARPARSGGDRRASCSSCSASCSRACCRGPSGCSRRALLTGARASGSRVLLGGAFAVCAAPCVGAVLGAILVLAGERGHRRRGLVLLAVYSLGLGAAFLLAGIAFTRAMAAFRWLRDHYRLIQVASGADARRARRCCSSSTATGGCTSSSTACWKRSGWASSSGGSARSRGRRDAAAASVDLAEDRATSTPRCAGAYGPSRRAAFSSWRSQPTRFPRPAWYQAT